MPETTILVADDEPSFRKIYRDVIESQGFQAVEAVDGEAALKLAKELKPSLILLDIIMPKMDGFAVLKEIRADPTTKSIPVIMFSVLGEKSDINKGIELGANDYALKGMTSPREIMQKIRTLISSPTAKLKEKPAPDAYRLRIEPNKGDATIFLSDLDMDKSFICAKCSNELNLELLRDLKHQPGNWFSAHLVCPVCKTEY